MYRLWFTFIIILFSCFHSMTATTHDKPFFFQHLTMEDGLSNNHVSAIFQSNSMNLTFFILSSSFFI